MGAYIGLYHGVYMQVPYGKKTVNYTAIIHPTTQKEMKTPFDPVSGEKGISVPKSKEEPKYPSPYIAGEHGLNQDCFWIAEYDGGPKNTKTFMLNNYNDFHFKASIESGEPKQFELPQFNVEVLLDQFKQVYKEYIELYEKEYGPVVIKYGIVIHYS